jgi:hypothetical protein
VDDHGVNPGAGLLRGKTTFYRLFFYFVNAGLKRWILSSGKEKARFRQKPTGTAVTVHARGILLSGKEELLFAQGVYSSVLDWSEKQY